ncbi:hypothetical protein L3073_06130 [Ancylomarina sp. DW003]|nr:hypothetical protein [Ancylomarina sp. DW003]MDE5421777.1 hypothetical protein [Ancylomarina sp. DW003]
MNENILKVSKIGLGLAIILICSLFILKCSEDKAGKKTSANNSESSVEDKKELITNAEKKNLPDVTSSFELKNKTFESKKVESDNVGTQVKKAVKTSVAKKAVYVQKQDKTEAGLEAKKENILAADIKLLEEKVKLLEERIKTIFETLKQYAEKKNENSAGEVDGFNTEKGLSQDNKIEDKVDEPSPFKYPTHVLAGGFSTYEGWTGYGLQGTYTYRMNDYLSLGVQGNGFFKDGKYKGDRQLYAGIRANFHIFPLIVENSNFDLYAGFTMGAKRDHAVTKLKTMGYFGMSYDFCRHWGVFAEAGNIGVVGLRLKF